MTASSPRRVGVIAALTLSSIVRIVSAQETLPPSLKAGVLADSHAIDGRLIEPAWANAPTIDAFIQNEPTEGAPPSARTTVRVLAGSTALVIGIHCEHAAGTTVSYSVRATRPRFGRSHACGTRPVSRRTLWLRVRNEPERRALRRPDRTGGEDDNEDWDGIWEAAAIREDCGTPHPAAHAQLQADFLATWHFESNAASSGCSKRIDGRRPRSNTS